CVALGLFYAPVGFAVARSRRPAASAVLSVMASVFSPLLNLTNPPSYDTSQFYNASLGVFVGCLIAALSFALLPPLPPALRTRRLLALALRDLRRPGEARWQPTSDDWHGRMMGRLAALSEQSEPLQRARLLAVLSVGSEIIRLRYLAERFGVSAQLDR